MNINLWLLSLLVLFQSCLNKKSEDSGDVRAVDYYSLKDSEDVSFRVQPLDSHNTQKVERSEFTALSFQFSSKDTTDFILDWKALSNECYNNIEDSTVKINGNLNDILKNIKYNQFLIQNTQNKFRFFSEKVYLNSSNHSLIDINCAGDWFKHIVIYPYDTICLKSSPILKDDLRVVKGDTLIRLYYLFSPTDKQRSLGYKKMILESNWFELK